MTITQISRSKMNKPHTQIEVGDCIVRLYGDQSFNVIPPNDVTYGEQVMAVAAAMAKLSGFGLIPANLLNNAA